MDAKRVASDGFLLNHVRDSLPDVALLSLRVALKAYFSTYKTMQYSIHLFEPQSKADQKTIDHGHSVAYCEASTEAILHFQHFVELFIKDVLRKEHPLLADVAAHDPIIFHKLLRKEPLQDAEQRGIRSIEFGESFDRFCRLVEAGRIDKGMYDFVVQAKPWIESLNALRNRLWHRGAFVLRYPALDDFVGRWVLPLVSTVTALPPYRDKEKIWRHQRLDCGVDPIAEIIKVCSAPSYDIGHVALLKELGRAAFACPYHDNNFASHIDAAVRRRLECAANQECSVPNVSGVTTCPVCGSKCLVISDDIELEGEDPPAGTYDRAWLYTWQVECRACSFAVNHHLKNASCYGLAIPDYWESHEL
jgi:hypothetical protein